MNKIIAVAISILGLFSVRSQELEGTEFGVDLTFYASSSQISSGTIGAGLKYGFKFGENFIAGPSVRYHRYWTNNTLTGQSAGFNIYGGGVFGHARFYNYLFLGAEIEFLRSPFTNFGTVNTATTGQWVGTCLIGGGFSREFNESIRVNAGIYYDILDVPNPSNPNNPNPNSPLQPYLARNANGTVIPILYRIAFFFPLT